MTKPAKKGDGCDPALAGFDRGSTGSHSGPADSRPGSAGPGSGTGSGPGPGLTGSDPGSAGTRSAGPGAAPDPGLGAGAAPVQAGGTTSGGRSVRATVGRAALVIVAATLVGRLLGLVRDIIVADLFGAQADTDAFFLAYKIPYLLTLMVSGALTATFVPLLSHRLAVGRKDEAWRLSVNMGNIICLVLVVVTVVLIIVAPWLIPLVGFGFGAATAEKAVFLFRILMLGFVFEGLTGLLVGMLNSLKRFALAAFAPAVGTVVVLVVTIALAGRLGITALAIGTVVGWAVGLLVLLPGLRDQDIGYRPRIDWHDPGVREVGGMIWPILIGSAVGKVSIFADQVLGSMLEEGSISSLNYAEKLFQVPLGLFVAGITVPIFPLLSEQVATHAPERVKATLDFALRLMGFLLVPVTVGVILLRYPIIGLLFEHGEFTGADTARTAWALLFLCLGLYAYAGRDTVTRVFYAYHDTRTPVKISVATVVINVALSYVLMQYMGVGGLALGTTVALTINFVVLMWLLRRKVGLLQLRGTARSLLAVTGVSAVMGGAVWALDFALGHVLANTLVGDAVRVVAGVLVGAAVFLAVARLVKIRELAEAVDMLREVLKRPKQRKTPTGGVSNY